MRPKALILHARGTNRDVDLCEALDLAGADCEIVPLTVLRRDNIDWGKFQMLGLAGGFSHGDSLGAGRLFALDLANYFSDQILEMNSRGSPIIGICNGFQALLRSGLLLGDSMPATLTHNSSGRFECRWVSVGIASQRSLWTEGLAAHLDCPVAHGEGRFVVSDADALILEANGQIALRYCDSKGDAAMGAHPQNPNGSVFDIAGVTNPEGNMLGLMPHPENHVHERQALGPSASALPLFSNGVKFAQEL